MILGAGISQVPLIQKAKEMGLWTIVASRPGDYPGLVLADQTCPIDTTHTKQIVAAAIAEKIDAICTTGTDVAVKSVAAAAAALGLAGISQEAANLCTDKLRMKDAFARNGILTARYVKVSHLCEAFEAYERIGSPAVFKAVDSGASKGIIRVDHQDQIPHAFSEVMKVTKQHFFIVEQWIEGVEFGAQAFVNNGRVQFVMPHGDMVFWGDAGVPIGHYVPLDQPLHVMTETENTMQACIHALQLDNCAINADFILKDGQIYVLEIGARAGGTCLPELVSIYYGYDYYEHIIRASLGESPEFNPVTRQCCACELLLSHTGGQITRMIDQNEPHPDLLQVSFDYVVGDTIPAFKVGTDRIGQIIVKGDSLEQTLLRLQSAKSHIRIETAG